MRFVSAVALGLGLSLGCARPGAPDPPEQVIAPECAAILTTILYDVERRDAAFGLDGQAEAELAEFVARMQATPELQLEIEVHMSAATRAELTPEQAEAHLRGLGREVLARFRTQVYPAGRISLVIHGVEGGPPDDPLEGDWVQLRRRCGPPAPDRDEDGIADAVDRCVDEPEDHDRFEDDDGCPDRDNDGDGILDAHTWTGTHWTNCDGKVERGGSRRDCRDLPETVDGEQDEDGCPEVALSNCGVLRVVIRYDPVTEALDEEGLLELEARRRRLGPGRVTGGVFELQGYTAGDVAPAEARALGLKMAEKVRDALLRRGFPHRRLVPSGRGAERPIADNQTPEGRAHNYRVEVVAGVGCVPPSTPLCPPG
jgi:hypothetical protein